MSALMRIIRYMCMQLRARSLQLLGIMKKKKKMNRSATLTSTWSTSQMIKLRYIFLPCVHKLHITHDDVKGEKNIEIFAVKLMK